MNMRIRYIVGVAILPFVQPIYAQEVDSLKSISLKEVVITKSYQHLRNQHSTLHIDAVGKAFLQTNFTGNLIQALGNIPGVQSMDIGSGFSKPMIRGMGFNRISVVENGIKQEGQQWGADHGLEIDAFNVEQVTILKGSSSLRYGSDAMGGVIEILPLAPPATNRITGEVSLLGKSVNNTIGASLLLGIKKDSWHTKFRYSEQDFGDYRIPAQSISYLTQEIPVYNKRLKNTAGKERSVNLFTSYRNGNYDANYMVSNTYQKTGFFPGAHGIPDASRVEDDGDSRNIGMPYSKVNHLKVSAMQRYALEELSLQWNIGYQNNHREEWSLFHTHYGNQPAPAKEPDKELAFTLSTYSSTMQVVLSKSDKWKHNAGWDLLYQQNKIGGYSFLLPQYTKFSTGAFLISTFSPSPSLSFSGGVRYDYGTIKADAFADTYLESYLHEQGYSAAEMEKYRWRSYAIDNSFGNYSASLGMVWTPSNQHLIQANIGRSFRLPGANELASNGVHHGTFRHEQGNSSLLSEQGWQADISYMYENSNISATLSPFASLYSNYIYLKPTGEWSILPHAGQIYRYTGAEALFGGAELSVSINFLRSLTYQFTGEYVYTHNRDEHIPLSFSPPTSVRNKLTWRNKLHSVHTEWHYIASQHRVARNEDPTDGAHLWNIGASTAIKVGGSMAEITFAVRNLLDTKYYNHLSFYRKVEIPEPGRSFQLLIKIPFKSLLK